MKITVLMKRIVAVQECDARPNAFHPGDQQVLMQGTSAGFIKNKIYE
jgi:hypothetical protein